MHRKFFFALLISIFYLTLFTEVLFATQVVRVAVHESKPISFTGEDGNVRGIYPEILMEIARLAEWDLQWVQVSWLEGLEMVERGDVELLGPISFTKERLKRFKFNHETLIVDWGQIYLPEGSEIKTLLDLSGKKVAIQRGHIMHKTLKELLYRFDITCQIILASDQRAVFKMASDGIVDAAAVNRLFGLLNEKDFSVQRSPIIYYPMELRFAAPKMGSTEIVKQLDKHLKALKQSKGSVYHSALDSYLFGGVGKERKISLRRIFIILGITVGVSLLLFVWMNILRSQVLSRTKELKESEERYRMLFNSANDAVFVHQPSKEGRPEKFIEVNDVACQMYGYTREKFFELTPPDLVLPEQKEDARMLIKRMLSETHSVFEIDHKTKDGKEVPVEISAHLFDYKGKPTILSIVRDITERKRVEDALRESEERYRLIAENVTDVIWTMDMNLDFTYISPSIYQQRGYTGEEAMEHSLGQVTMPDPLEKVMNLFAEKVSLIDSGDEEGFKSVDFEVEQPCKDGSVIWTSNNARILPGPDKQPASILGITRGITERKQWENSIEISRARFRQLFNDAPVIYVITEDRNQIPYITEVNRMFVSTLGYERQDVLGTPLANFYTDSSRIKLFGKGGYQRALKGEFVAEERSLRTINGEVVHTILHAKPEYNDKGRVIGTLATFLDITARKIAEEESKRLEMVVAQAIKIETIGTLAGGIAHDLNNILFPIVGNTEMLLEDIPKDSPLRGNLNEVFNGAMRAKDLVKQILAFSRQDSPEIKLMRMQPIIKDALKLIRSTIPTSIEIKQTVSHDCRAIKADPTQIHQVVMNLATNAYHAMEDTGGEIKVNLMEVELGEQDLPIPDMEPGPFACLIVADSGTGIDDNVRERIFDPYFTTKEQGKGTGMGLSVVHGIVKKAGGSIQMYSELGKGTEFHVYLPIVQTSFEQPEAQAKEPIQRGTERILLVDDEDAIIFMEKQMLERLGYSVVSRTSSVEALEAFRIMPDKFDLVITDMAMPNMSGDKLASELIKIRSDIPILICTGFSEKVPAEKAKTFGIKGFLMKPIVKKDLSKKIRELLDKGQEKSN